jgi:hypothetical protein
MASMGASPLDYEPVARDILIRQIKNGGYVNKLLQHICQAEGISASGVKAQLQNRIVDSKSIQTSLIHMPLDIFKR